MDLLETWGEDVARSAAGLGEDEQNPLPAISLEVELLSVQGRQVDRRSRRAGSKACSQQSALLERLVAAVLAVRRFRVPPHGRGGRWLRSQQREHRRSADGNVTRDLSVLVDEICHRRPADAVSRPDVVRPLKQDRTPEAMALDHVSLLLESSGADDD